MMMGTGGAGPGTTPAGISLPSFTTSLFTGAASVTIPIEVPPGKAGIAPKLALTYNSYQGNGWVGVGWNIDMGSIQRSTKWGVNYSANDFVASINGSASELIPRADWGTNYYGAKIEGGLSRYYKNPATGGWEVTSKDGTKYYYGTTSAARQDFGSPVFKWCLDKVQDANGNYMTVNYWKDSGYGEIYIDKIEYTGNNSLLPTHKVKFNISLGRTDMPLLYTTNYLVHLVIDDFGLQRLTSSEAQDLYEVMIERYQRASTVITSSRPLEEWMSLFDDPLLANSLLDRLAHNAHQIFIEGESYRKRMGRAKRTTEKN